MYMLAVDPQDAPNQPEYVEIGFVSGIPVSVNRKELSPAFILSEFNKIGGRHGIGRIDMVENQFVGMKSHGVYETPGGTILFTATREMESLTLDRESMQVKDSLPLKYVELLYVGRWFDPLRESMDAFMEQICKATTGSVSLKLYKGSINVASWKSPFSLYRQDISSFETGDIYDQADAAGFIRLYVLPMRFDTLTHPFDELRDPNTRLPNGGFLPPLLNFKAHGVPPEILLKLIPKHAKKQCNFLAL